MMLTKKNLQFLVLHLLLFVGLTLPISAQKPLHQQHVYETQVQGKPAKPVELFSPGWTSATENYSNIVRAGVILNFDDKKAGEFLKNNTREFSLTLPTGQGNQSITLQMHRSHIFAPGFKVYVSSDPRKPYDYQGGLHFHGVVKGDPHSKVAISVFDNEVMGLIITHNGNYNLGKLENSEKGHILYLDRDLLQKPNFDCSMEDDHRGYSEAEISATEKAAGDCIAVYVEVDKTVTDNKGGVTNATNYVTGAFNQNVLLYNAENIGMAISEMFVWNTPTPYSGPSAGSYLSQFQANTGAFNGDLGHLVAMVNNGGIAAGFSGICNPNTDESLCYSGILDFYENVPVFSFTVMILAHEMGHLIGSRHTHACVWNGNNTAIDGCAGYVETDVANCPLPGSPAGGGTIMSYCHNDPVGVNFNLGFGLQPGNVLRNTVANATCLGTACVICDINITGVNTTVPSCNANNGSITITATSSASPITYSITGPVNQSNNTGVFTGLPTGGYQIQVEDSQGCKDYALASLYYVSADVPKAISVTGTSTVTSVLNIPATGAITGVRLLGLDITHSWVGDLSATLTSPTGAVINLFDRPGYNGSGFGCTNNNIFVNFSDAAVLTASDFENTCNTLPAISGTYQPITPFSSLNGLAANGQWTLTVYDNASGDGGAINSWGLEVCVSTCDLAITNVSSTNETCPNANNGSITVTATTSNGPLTYAISGPVNQSNGTGVFTNLPDGSYNILVTDNGTSNCTDTDTRSIAAGVDNTPPNPVCRTATVTLNAAGTYTLLAADVFNQAASTDNCGTVNFVSASPASVNCAHVGQTVAVTVSVNDGNGNTANCTAQITVQEGTALPAGWTNANIGNAQGSAIYKPCTEGGQYTLTSTGYSNNPDLQHSAWRSLCGNGSITARVSSVSNLGWAGIEMRESAMPGSRKVALKTQLSTIVRRVLRSLPNAMAQTQQFPVLEGQNWLRITRTGNSFAFYVSSNGVNWQQVGAATNLMLPTCLQVGLFAESINVNTTTTAIFDNVVVSGAASPLAAPNTNPIDAAQLELDLDVFPNPSEGEVMVNLGAYANRAVRMEVFDAQGKALRTIELDAVETSIERLDLSAYQNGMYLIRVQSEGVADVTKRIVLTRNK